MQSLEFFYAELYLSAMILLLLGLDLAKFNKNWLEIVFILGLLGLFLIPTRAIDSGNFGHMLTGKLQPWLSVLILGTLLSVFLGKPAKAQAESYVLILGVLVGLVFALRSSHLIMLLTGMECASFCSYGLVALQSPKSSAPLRYLLFGAIVSGLAFYASSWLYGFCGGLAFEDMIKQSHKPEVMTLLGLVILTLVFKLAAFPLQQWLPEVVEESPVYVAAFVGVVPKLGAAVALQNLLPYDNQIFLTALAILATLTLYLGNILAIREKKLKTMLAFATIAQSGFLLLAVAVSQEILFFYTLVSAIMGVGIFMVALPFESQQRNPEIKDIELLSHKWLALGATLCAAALAGLPLTAGFTAKFMVLSNFWSNDFRWAVVLALLTLPLSWAYLLKIPYYFFVSNKGSFSFEMRGKSWFLFVFVAFALVLLFIFPQMLLNRFFQS